MVNKMINVNLIIQPKEINDKWVTYLLYDKNHKLQHIGISQLIKLFSLADAKRNPAFFKYFPSDQELTLSVFELFNNRAEAIKAQSELIRKYNLPDMMKQAGNKHLPIKCNETGEIFKSVQDVCFAHGVTASAVSQHLNNTPGFRTVKNRTYTRFIY